MLIDSNILVYALNTASEKCMAAQQFINNEDELITSQQNIFETLRVLTHTKFPTPYLPKDAVQAIEEVTSQFVVIQPLPETAEIAYELIQKYQISGPEVFDAYLVATCLSHQITQIATDNVKHLGKYSEIQVYNPFVLQEN
jgi:predicted nucleic acid-binding protein